MTIVWLVGSQQGFLDQLDDCIIHGVFPDKVSGVACIMELQLQSPNDTFGLIVIQMGKRCNVGFSSLDSSWIWYKPLECNDTSSTPSLLQLPDSITSDNAGVKVDVRAHVSFTHHQAHIEKDTQYIHTLDI